MTMKPIAAAAAGALISGVAMYTVGAKTATVDAFTQAPALVQTADGQYVPASQLATVPASQLVSQRQVVSRPASAPRRTVNRSAPAQSERVVAREAPQGRSWKKTAMIIGGSTASGAGVGAIVGGKKGALIGAAIGGGAASIFESTKRN
jgi:hypothetical protein